MNTLPAEIITDIIEYAYYTNGIVQFKTLLSCALLCRTWSEPAQRMLFRRVESLGGHGGHAYKEFLAVTNPETERGRTLGGYVHVLELAVGDAIAGDSIIDTDLATILSHTPRLYQLDLWVFHIHQFTDQAMERLKSLAAPRQDESTDEKSHGVSEPLRIRALSIMCCGIQSPVLYQLLGVWPCIKFLCIGVEIAAPPPKWQPEFELYQITFMRTPRCHIISWLLFSSMQSLRIASFRDAPGREIDRILQEVGPRLRSLRLVNYSQRVAAVINHCPNIEEFVLVQLSRLFKLDKLPRTLEHLNCRNLPAEEQGLDLVMEAVKTLPKLRVVTCAERARADKLFRELEKVCASKDIQLYIDEKPFWVRDDPVYVTQFPNIKSVSNFALMV